MLIKILLILLIIGVFFIFCACIVPAKESMFVTPPELVLYYKTGCPACMAIMPEWEKLVEDLKDSCVITKAVEIRKNPYYGEERGTVIRSIPKIIFYAYGDYNTQETYNENANITADAVKRWVADRVTNMRLC